ncbi:hypothetical protein L21_0732 [Methanoculleus chikugoensis]|jgi:hypothetical protein|uniref:ABC-2 type transport system permease protein n=1 Tax=Methanoculleus chikugoensis TaxID=118126 RepID=A0A1M4MJ55_9EURY|nr:hypothetical protein [Methanoculleus chikugoensis]NMA09788.1 hypothetical protein [Methanomicrobiales archaeon]SCL74848.1 hypothetical protein L21_0732 [Methanoculleus chikugoensis]
MPVPDLFRAMMKEEWRMHSTIFGSLGFALFPAVIAVFAFFGALTLPIFADVFPYDVVALLIHTLFMLMGVMVGSFGLMGREFMNRRFGQASLIAYASRSLPVSERRIFAAFLVKDTVYYILLYVLPFAAGFTAATPFTGLDPALGLLAFVSLALAFLLGLSAVCFLSTLYARSVALLAGTAAVLAVAAIAAFRLGAITVSAVLPPYAFFLDPAAEPLALSLLLILVPAAVSVLFVTVDYPDRTKRFTNRLDPLAGRLRGLGSAHFIAKDALDLLRSEGGAGKVIFSFLLPLGLVWVCLQVLIRFIPGVDPLVVFAVLLGVISATIYNWLTEFDSFTSYTFLPVEISEVIDAKLKSYALANLLPLGVLVLAAATSGGAGTFLPALAAFASVSAYTLAVTVYLTGLHPNVMLYHAWVFLRYLLAISPALLLLIFASIVDPAYAALSLLLVAPAAFLLARARTRWQAWEMPTY